MQRSDRLKIVLDMETRREEAARKLMQSALDAHEAESGRLHELQRYHEEYQDQIRQQQGAQTVQRLIAWQQFISQLNQAIDQQQAQQRRLQAKLDEARKRWRSAWEKREAMARHIESCRYQEQQDADRREQKAVDEAASLRFVRTGRQR